MDRIGKYELIEEIGRGGFGTVYRAKDPYLDIERAIKLLHPLLNSDPDFVQRFRQEARVVARLKHPRIIPVYDLGQSEGWMFLVMELMQGGSLKTKIKESIFSFQHTLVVLKQVAEALSYAHEKGIIHRDIKPENILFDENGHAHLSDFGFARSLSKADISTTMSLTGGALGTPAYMAPEAWEGEGWTTAADVYSLACMFVEMLTGKVLFKATSPVQAMKKHVIEGPKFPDSWPEDTPDNLEEVLKKGLAKESDERYQQVNEFITALENLGQPADAQDPVSIPERGLIAEEPSSATIALEAVRDEEFGQEEIGMPGAEVPSSPDRFKPGGNKWIAWLTAGIAVLVIAVLVVQSYWPIETTEPLEAVSESQNSVSQEETEDEISDNSVIREFARGHVWELILIPAGPFIMGSGTNPPEGPEHEVSLDDYFINKTEVTNAQYDLCVNTGACTLPFGTTGSEMRADYFYNADYADYPVAGVDWFDARNFCEWAGGRLPTEAEWEKAARGSEDVRKYPWGNVPAYCDLVNFGGCQDGPGKVWWYVNGASPYGVLNMAGNVLEWVYDWFDESYYERSPDTNPTGPSEGTQKILKGGSYRYGAVDLRLTLRSVQNPTAFYVDAGFRCAISPQQ